MGILESILEWLSHLVINVINSTGYAGIGFLMAVESANIPVPSEVIMPFSGFLVSQGVLNFWLVTLAGAVGNLVGSLASYWIGAVGGRPFLEKYGKYFFVHRHDLDKGDELFVKYGESIAFFSRLLPIIRTFISLPAGIARMNLWKFSVYTFIGSFFWSGILAYAGLKAGENWTFLEPYFRRFDWLIALLIVLAGIWWIARYIREVRNDHHHSETHTTSQHHNSTEDHRDPLSE